MGKILICTVGLPRSGKSTWVKSHSIMHGWPMVSPDAIRISLYGQRFYKGGEKHVWAIVDTMIRSLFTAGHDTIILDSTNILRAHRDQWKSNDWETYFHHVDTNHEICKSRAIETNMPDLVEVIDKMNSIFEPLNDDENKVRINNKL